MLKIFNKFILLPFLILFSVFLEFIITQVLDYYTPRVDLILIFILLVYFSYDYSNSLLFIIGIIKSILFTSPLGVTSVVYMLSSKFYFRETSEGKFFQSLICFIIYAIFVLAFEWTTNSIFQKSLLSVDKLLITLTITLSIFVIVSYITSKMIYRDDNSLIKKKLKV